MMEKKMQEAESFKAVRKQTLEYSGAFREKGITLIALVITIVVLLILAGISLNLVLGENGIVTKAKDAREQTIIGHEKEQINLAYSACKTRENFDDLVTAIELETEMKKSNENVSVVADGDNLVITFEKTKHQYNIGQDGNFKENTNQNIDWSKLEPGLYKTGTSEMIKSWQELIDDGDITVDGTKLVATRIVERYQTQDTPLQGDLVILNGITEIGNLTGDKEMCYVGTSGITGAYVPSSVKKLTSSEHGYGTFYAMWYLKKVVIEEGLEEIGDTAFSYCDVTEINLPDTVTNIGNWAFSNNRSLTKVRIPDNVTIGNGCFAYTGLTQFPKNITSIGDHMFYECNELTIENIPSGITSIGKDAFCGCNITNINILNGVTSIGKGAFAGCNLTSINIPNGITLIDEETFASCNLTSINIPNGVTSIGRSAFANCNEMKSINIPNSVKKIGAEAFKDCVNLSDINGFDNAISVGPGSLDGTKWYNSQPDGEVYIGKTLYNYKGTMSADTRLKIKDGTENIPDRAFGDCTGLIEVTLPSSVKNIGEYCFYNCKNLSDVNVNEGIERIGWCAFSETKWQDSQNDGYIYIGNVLYYYKGSESPKEVQVKDGTISITEGAIYPDTIIIPKSVKYIGEGILGRSTSHNCVVNYMGTEEEWNSIEIEESNFSGNLTINYNYTGE